MRPVTVWPAAVLAALALYLGWAALLWAVQRSMMFPGAGVRARAPAPPARGFEVWSVSAAGCEVEAWYHPPRAWEGGAAPVAHPAVIFSHGNGELIDDWYGAFQALAERGIGVLLVEFPGYGRSRGGPTQESVTATLRAAYDRLAELPATDSARIVGVGRSLGGGAVCALSLERPFAAMVLMSTFTSARWFARRFLLPGFLVRDPFDNRAALARFGGPVLVVHGKRDATIPYEHSEVLHRAAADAHLIVYEAGHGDCPPDWEEFVGRVAQLVERAPPAETEDR